MDYWITFHFAGIIHEPLGQIYSKKKLLQPISINPVRLHIYHSGLMIEIRYGQHDGHLVWYSIRNLYCSAALQPDFTDLESDSSVEFKALDDPDLTGHASCLRPIFALVVRETVTRKVLQCHAFSVKDKKIAQFLVKATAKAYKDRSGWDQPILDPMFSGEDTSSTLEILDDKEDDYMEPSALRYHDNRLYSGPSHPLLRSSSPPGTPYDTPSMLSDSSSQLSSHPSSLLASPVPYDEPDWRHCFPNEGHHHLASDLSRLGYAPHHQRIPHHSRLDRALSSSPRPHDHYIVLQKINSPVRRLHSAPVEAFGKLSVHSPTSSNPEFTDGSCPSPPQANRNNNTSSIPEPPREPPAFLLKKPSKTKKSKFFSKSKRKEKSVERAPGNDTIMGRPRNRETESDTLTPDLQSASRSESSRIDTENNDISDTWSEIDRIYPPPDINGFGGDSNDELSESHPEYLMYGGDASQLAKPKPLEDNNKRKLSKKNRKVSTAQSFPIVLCITPLRVFP